LAVRCVCEYARHPADAREVHRVNRERNDPGKGLQFVAGLPKVTRYMRKGFYRYGSGTLAGGCGA